MFSTLKLKKIRFTIEIIIRLGSLEMHNTRYLVSYLEVTLEIGNIDIPHNITSFKTQVLFFRQLLSNYH
jgi:hypothetical protein